MYLDFWAFHMTGSKIWGNFGIASSFPLHVGKLIREYPPLQLWGFIFSPYLGSALLKIISNLAGNCLFLIHADDSFDLSTEGTAYGPTFKPLCTQHQTSLFYK